MLYNGHIFTNQYGEKFRRVNKREARNLASKNIAIGVCACNMNPFSMWCTCIWFNPADDDMTFDQFVNWFEYYNCSAETGYYAAYYVEVNA